MLKLFWLQQLKSVKEDIIENFGAKYFRSMYENLWRENIQIFREKLANLFYIQKNVNDRLIKIKDI